MLIPRLAPVPTTVVRRPLLGLVRVPVVPWDERLTSALADKALLEAELSRRQRRAAVDKVSAILILQNYLDYRKVTGVEARDSA